MQTVYEIVKEIETTSSKNGKLAILKANKSNDDLREFFYLALEPTVLFWIKSIPAARPDASKEQISLMDATYELVNRIASRELTGHDALNLVTDLASRMSAGDADLFYRIVKKDASVGVSEKTVNKVWKGLCTEKLYMRCASFKQENLDKVDFPAFAQLKADGQFINIIIKPAQRVVNFLSRNMKPMDLHGHLEEALLDMEFAGDTIVHGEGLVRKADGSGFEDRKTGNGIIGKAVKGTISEEEASRIHLKIWDVMPLSAWKSKRCDFPYELRLKTLEEHMTDEPKIKIIATKKINSLDEGFVFFNKMLDRGQEGAILKNLDGIWKNSSSGTPDCVKMKKKDPADLLCVGTIPHSKATVTRGDKVIDSSNWVGSLMLESSDGKIAVNSGSGLDDEDRAKGADFYIGKIIEVEYNEIITSKNKDVASLFLPIVKEVRDDKDEADSYELIVERAKGRK